MKILNQNIARMYVLTIILLSTFAIISSYTLKQVPYALIAAILTSSLVEVAIMKFYLKQSAKIPFSAIITGLIIGSVAPINASILLVVLASIIAIASKFLIKAKGSNVFNPATLGLLIALAIFGVGDQWWAAGSYNLFGIAVSLTPLLIISAYESRRVISGISFVIISMIISLALSRSGDIASFGYILTLIFSVNYLFAFVMVADPKTSPNKNSMQALFGGSIALISAALVIYGIPYALLIALLMGNISYLAYRIRTGNR